jgi:hypothetical protein
MRDGYAAWKTLIIFKENVENLQQPTMIRGMKTEFCLSVLGVLLMEVYDLFSEII